MPNHIGKSPFHGVCKMPILWDSIALKPRKYAKNGKNHTGSIPVGVMPLTLVVRGFSISWVKI